MMKHCIVYIGLLINTMIFISCSKVISVELNDAAKKYVVEGNITNVPGQCEVHITQTKNFSDDNTFPGISGAIVTISDNGASPILLTESTPGNYSTNLLNGTAGHIYILNIIVGEQVFSGSSTMPESVNLDSIHIEDKIVFGDSTRTVRANYTDPLVKGNAYHFIQFKNSIRVKALFAVNDELSNGNAVSTSLMTYDNSVDDDKLWTGDSVTVIMECVDMPVYHFWFSSGSSTGQNDGVTPTNPVSNISGGALGYFSAHTTQSKTITVP